MDYTPSLNINFWIDRKPSELNCLRKPNFLFLSLIDCHSKEVRECHVQLLLQVDFWFVFLVYAREGYKVTSGMSYIMHSCQIEIRIVSV